MCNLSSRFLPEWKTMEHDSLALVSKSFSVPPENVCIVSNESIASLWAGMGEIFEIRFYLNDNEKNIISMICKKICLPANEGSISYGDMRKKKSYEVEKCFYDRFASILNKNDVTVPEGLYTKNSCSNLFICMTRLKGKSLSNLGIKNAKRAVKWAAKLHALTWGVRADEFVASMGLQSQGTYWYLDTRPNEFENIPRKGWEGRLYSAARAIDERLKADPFQSIIHGDFKAANMVSDGVDNFGMCDFQYCGKGCCLKDICYMIACYCSSSNIDSEGDRVHHPFEEAIFDLYYAELKANAAKQGLLEVPSYDALLDAADLCFVDITRWMAGWGYWGNSFLIPRTQKILDKIDNGTLLSSENAYRQAVQSVYTINNVNV